MKPLLWDGVTLRSSFSEQVVQARDRLANAARSGDWATVFDVLADEPGWVNSGRIGGPSRYTPLHQAAWHGANPDVIDRLLDLGAWRTARTARGETARDIALRRRHTQLTELLTPVVRHPVNADVLTRLEHHFHGLIRERVGDLVTKHRLRLPELTMLTEVAKPAFWFPVPGFYGGFQYTLEGENWRSTAGAGSPAAPGRRTGSRPTAYDSSNRLGLSDGLGEATFEGGALIELPRHAVRGDLRIRAGIAGRRRRTRPGGGRGDGARLILRLRRGDLLLRLSQEFQQPAVP